MASYELMFILKPELDDDQVATATDRVHQLVVANGGDVTKTVQNLDVIRIDEARQLLLVRGAVPGSKNGHVVVSHAIKAKVKKGAQ